MADNLSKICCWVKTSHTMYKDCRGHTGAMMSLRKGATTSFSNKQKINTKSSTESELVSADQALSSILHTGYFIEAQGYFVKHNLPFQDNQSTMHLEVNGSLSSSKCTKHIKCCFFFICNKIANGNLKVLYCPTESMWADVLTKPKQGGPFHLDRSHLMHIPINYDDNAECLKTNPLLLLSDKHPLCPSQMSNQLPKTPIIHSRNVLAIKYPSPAKLVPGTPPMPITWKLTSLGSSLSWADRVRIPIATK
jgi:hypothetical protein